MLYEVITNLGAINAIGASTYGIHIQFSGDSSIPGDMPDPIEEDPVYAYPDINISNSGLGSIYVLGEVESEGIKIDTPISRVSIENSHSIAAKVEQEAYDATSRDEFGAATGVNIFLASEDEEAENPVPEWRVVDEPTTEEEISPIAMDIDVHNSGIIDTAVANRETARIMGT